VLTAAGLEDQMREINASAVRLAQEAWSHASAGRQVWIAGSISTMAPGADKSRRPSVEQMRVSLQEQAETLAAEGVGLLVLEMMRDVTYSIAAVQAAVCTALPIWVGFSCSQRADGSLILYPGINGTVTLEEALGPVMQQGGSLVAVMHSEVNDTGPALMTLLEHWQGPVGAYPHSGSFAMPHWQFVDIISPEVLVQEARQWVALGAQVIGGCCGIGPDHIRLLKERLPAHLP
jgi:S-methylmethionine-dependent homocysteine/selenocysteine methylase